MSCRYTLLIIALSFPSLLLAQVDYNEDIQPIFNQQCVSCHGNESGVTLSSYSATMNSVGAQYGVLIVSPGDPDNSPLVDKIEPNPRFGVRMPQSAQPLSDAQINLIRQWIAEGANETATNNEVETDLPEGFKLNGNYPNPFNPTTNIQFELPQSGTVEILVYSIQGRLLSKLSDQVRAGETTMPIDLSGRSSGIYIYKVMARVNNKFYELGTGRMSLIK